MSGLSKIAEVLLGSQLKRTPKQREWNADVEGVVHVSIAWRVLKGCLQSPCRMHWIVGPQARWSCQVQESFFTPRGDRRRAGNTRTDQSGSFEQMVHVLDNRVEAWVVSKSLNSEQIRAKRARRPSVEPNKQSAAMTKVCI